MTNIRHFCVASNSHYPMQTIKTMWKAIFQNKLTIYKANLPSFVKKIIKTRCYVDLSRRPRLKCHPKMAAWERLIKEIALLQLGCDNSRNYVAEVRQYYGLVLLCFQPSTTMDNKISGLDTSWRHSLNLVAICDVTRIAKVLGFFVVSLNFPL
jgi:hypothetical protein